MKIVYSIILVLLSIASFYIAYQNYNIHKHEYKHKIFLLLFEWDFVVFMSLGIGLLLTALSFWIVLKS